MILEAFSERLKEGHHARHSPEDVLHQWLSEMLLVKPSSATDAIGRVIQTEIELVSWNGNVHFQGRSKTGRKLLESLYRYCQSYENWQFTRWLHTLKASDF